LTPLRGIVLAVLASSMAALAADYPLIRSLGPEDLLFRQLEEQIREGYADEMGGPGGRAEGEIGVYRYVLPTDSDIFELAARINLPYETVSTLNRLSGPGPYKAGSVILIPSRPGIFLPIKASSELEALMLSWRVPEGGESSEAGKRPRSAEITVRRTGSGAERLLFIPSARFSPEERAYFLNGLFIYPLPRGTLTSSFGYRISPISGAFVFHAGIDISAPEGTEVYAARGGSVSAAGWDEALGNMVAIDHGDGYSSVYGHLSSIGASLRQKVKSGMIVGRVGSTGKSTGPHLHFEIRSRGSAVDPQSLVPRVKR
jgi:murein DD-endopeptidase MepM/ murein hydrolase activator NlpD